MKLIMENWRQFVNEQEEPTGIKTFEELKGLLQSIELRRKGGIAAEKAGRFLAGLIPGGSAALEMVDSAKDAYDFIKNIYGADDNFKTQSALDRLNVNDEISAIVDDQVEAAFLKMLPKALADKTGPIPADFTVTKALQDYLAGKFQGTTVKK